MAYWDKITSTGNVEDRRQTPLVVGGIGGLGVLGTVIYLIVSLLLAFSWQGIVKVVWIYFLVGNTLTQPA